MAKFPPFFIWLAFSWELERLRSFYSLSSALIFLFEVSDYSTLSEFSGSLSEIEELAESSSSSEDHLMVETTSELFF